MKNFLITQMIFLPFADPERSIPIESVKIYNFYSTKCKLYSIKCATPFFAHITNSLSVFTLVAL